MVLLCYKGHFAGVVWFYSSQREASLQSIQYKVILKNLLYPTMKIFYPDGNGLGQGDCPHPQCLRAH